MPSNGSGVYSLPSGYLAVAGNTILASQHNDPLEDLAQGLTDRLMRDGRAPMTGNLAMGTNKVTGLGTPSAGTDATTKTYVDTAVATKADTVHTHAASAITSGQLDGARMPAYLILANLQELSMEQIGGGVDGVRTRAQNTAALTSFWTNDRKTVVLGRGRYLIDHASHYTLPSDGLISIRGQGARSSVLNIPDGTGSSDTAPLRITIPAGNQLDGIKQSITMSGFKIECSDDQQEFMLDIDYPDANAGTDSGLSCAVRLTDLTFGGLGPDDFIRTAALRMRNVTRALVRGCDFKGGIVSSVAQKIGQAIRLEGTKNNYANQIIQCYAENFDTCLEVVGKYEGTRVLFNDFLSCKKAVLLSNGGATASEPQHIIVGNELAADERMVEIRNLNEVFIAHNTMRYVVGSGVPVGVYLTGEDISGGMDGDAEISHNRFLSTVALSTQQGLDIRGNYRSVIYSNNFFNGINLCVGIASGSTNIKGIANLARTHTTKITDLGSHASNTAAASAFF